jgi:hypothetical protein
MEETKRYLELEKRLNDIANASLPKPVEDVKIVLKKKVASPESELKLLTPDQLDLRDLTYEARLNTIANNAVVRKLGWKPSKIKTDITKEMIADYQFEVQKNVSRGLYLPANIDLDLERVDDGFLPALNEADVERIKRQRDGFMRLNKEIERKLQENAPALLDDLAERESFLYADTRDAYGGYVPEIDVIMSVKPEGMSKAEITALRARWEKLLAERGELERQIANARRDYADNEFRIDRATAAIKEHKDQVQAYAAEKAAVEQRNAGRKKLFVDELKVLNSGRLDVEMLPNETPEEYKARLESIGATTPDQDAVQAAAKLFYTDVLREKLQELMSSDADISTFINDMDGDERYTVVKNFPEFKKKFQDIMGKERVGGLGVISTLLEIKDNLVGTLAQKNVDETTKLVAAAAEVLDAIPVDAEALAEIRDEIALSRQLTAGQRKNLESFLVDKNAREYVTKGAQPSDDKKTAYENFRSRIRQIYEAPTTVRPSRAAEAARKVGPLLEAAPPVKKERGLASTDEQQFTMLRDNIRARLDQIVKLDPERRDAGLQGEYDYLFPLTRTRNLTELRDAAEESSIDLLQFNTRGSGLMRKHAQVVPFGRVDIHPQRLFYDNVLKITKNGRAVTGMPNVKVSDAFGDVVLSVLKGQTPTLSAFKRMTAEDKKLYDMLVFASGLHKDVETVGSGVKQELKKRLELIEGEIQAGNSNPLLIKEARQVLHRMAQMRMVSRPKAVAHLKQLQAF